MPQVNIKTPDGKTLEVPFTGAPPSPSEMQDIVDGYERTSGAASAVAGFAGRIAAPAQAIQRNAATVHARPPAPARTYAPPPGRMGMGAVHAPGVAARINQGIANGLLGVSNLLHSNDEANAGNELAQVGTGLLSAPVDTLLNAWQGEGQSIEKHGPVGSALRHAVPGLNPTQGVVAGALTAPYQPLGLGATIDAVKALPAAARGNTAPLRAAGGEFAQVPGYVKAHPLSTVLALAPFLPKALHGVLPEAVRDVPAIAPRRVKAPPVSLRPQNVPRKGGATVPTAPAVEGRTGTAAPVQAPAAAPDPMAGLLDAEAQARARLAAKAAPVPPPPIAEAFPAPPVTQAPRITPGAIPAPKDIPSTDPRYGTAADPRFPEARAVLARSPGMKASELQRELGVGYTRAAQFLEQAEARPLAAQTPAPALPPGPRPMTPPSEPVTAPTPAGPPSDPRFVENFPTAQLKADPERFQYKIGYGQGGASGSLTDVKAYNPDFAGVLHAWRDPADGQAYVVNGHNRFALAQRTGTAGVDVRFIDAKDAAEARTKGALMNIAEGQGTALDAAKLFRDSKMTPADVQAMGVNLKGQRAAQGLALANLNDGLFNMAVRGEMPVERAALIGEKLPDAGDQQTLMKQIEGRNVTNADLAEMADQIAHGPKQDETTASLFGTDTTTRSLAVERGQAASFIKSQLTGEGAAFGNAAKNADRLKKGNNAIDVEQSNALALLNRQGAELFDAHKNAAGPVADILNDAARRLARAKETGEKPDVIKQDALRAYQSLVPDLAKGAEPAAARAAGVPAADLGAAAPEPARGVPPGAADRGELPQAEVGPQETLRNGAQPFNTNYGILKAWQDAWDGADVSDYLEDHYQGGKRNPQQSYAQSILEYHGGATQFHPNVLEWAKRNASRRDIEVFEARQNVDRSEGSDPIAGKRPDADGPQADLFGADPSANDLTLTAPKEKPAPVKKAAPAVANEALNFSDAPPRPFEGDTRLPAVVRSFVHDAPESGGALSHSSRIYGDATDNRIAFRETQRALEGLAAANHGAIFRKTTHEGETTTYRLSDGGHDLAVSLNPDQTVSVRVQPKGEETGGMFADGPSLPTEGGGVKPGDSVAYQGDDGRTYLGTLREVTGARAVVDVTGTDRPRGFKPGPRSVQTESLQKQTSTPRVPTGAHGTPIRELEAPAKPNPTATGRVAPAPIAGGVPKKLSQIVFDAGKSVDRRVLTMKQGRGVAGTYYPGSSRVSVRFAGDLDTTAHELAHALDDRHGIVAPWNHPRMRAPFDDELKPFWEAGGSATKSGPKSRLAYKRAEGVAEFVRAYVVNPDEAKARAPQFHQHFVSTVPADVLDKIHEFSKDVRQFAGLDASEKIGANVGLHAERTTPVQALKRFIKGDGWDFETTGLDRLRAVAQDKLRPFAKAVRAARQVTGKGALPADDPLVLARLHSGMGGKVLNILDKGMVDAQGKRVTPGGLDWMLEPLDNSTKEALEADLDDTVILMIAQRTLEKGPQLNTERVTGIGGGLYSDTAVARQALQEFGADPARLARLEEGAKRYREWADKLLQYQVQKGRLSQASYDAIKAENQQYVALHREMDKIGPAGAGGGSKLGSAKETINTFKGSTREIQNPYRTLADQTQAMVAEADRNEVLKAFRDMLTSDRGMHQGAAQNLSAIGRRAKVGDDNAVRIFVDGKPEYWQFEKGVYEALKGFGSEAQLPKVFTLPASLMRDSVTHAPDFLVRNVFRDAVDRTLLSKHGGTPWDVIGKTSEADRDAFDLSGGGQAGHYLVSKDGYGKAMEAAVKRLSQDKNTILALPGDFYGKYQHLAHSSEMVGRYAEYKKAFAHAKTNLGYDDYNAGLYAASEARGLMDFAVSGSFGQKVNQVVPFTNAAIQGTTNLLRAARANPRAFLARWAVYVVAPEVAVYAWNMSQGKDTRDEYRQLPAYQRDMFYNIKAGPDLWVRIPKGFEMATLASGVSRTIDKISGNKDAFEGYGGDVAKSFIPVSPDLLASGLLPSVAENMNNYDVFRGTSIVPPYEDKLRLDLRKGTGKASRLGQAMGRVLGADPRKMDHFVKSQFGGLGTMATRASDLGRADKSSGRDLLMALPGVLSSSPSINSPDVQAVMDGSQQLGRRNPLKGPMDDFYAAKTPAERDRAARGLRALAHQLRPALEGDLQKPPDLLKALAGAGGRRRGARRPSRPRR